MAGEWVLGCFWWPREDHHNFFPHHVEQWFWEVGEGFKMCFRHLSEWTGRNIHPSVEACKSHTHCPWVQSVLNDPHHLRLIGPQCWYLDFQPNCWPILYLLREFAGNYIVSFVRWYCAVVKWWGGLFGEVGWWLGGCREGCSGSLCVGMSVGRGGGR